MLITACQDTSVCVEDRQAFKEVFSMCMERENIRYNMDENLWPNPEDQVD